MLGLPPSTRVWVAAGHTDMRKGFDGLAALVQTALTGNPCSGHVFVFRGKRGDMIKVLWFDGQGLLLWSKRLERGRFVWSQATSGAVSLTPAQLSMLPERLLVEKLKLEIAWFRRDKFGASSERLEHIEQLELLVEDLGTRCSALPDGEAQSTAASTPAHHPPARSCTQTTHRWPCSRQARGARRLGGCERTFGTSAPRAVSCRQPCGSSTHPTARASGHRNT